MHGEFREILLVSDLKLRGEVSFFSNFKKLSLARMCSRKGTELKK